MKKILLLAVILISSSCVAQRSTLKNVHEKDGKVGIGTKSPDEMLTVKGKIHTQEVIVDLQGAVAPDYVFESYFLGISTSNPNYKMADLAEIEAYIKKHHHLPEIPSAKEMEADGVSLKAMNLLLLQKIEELTLYTIEQQKQIDALKEKVESVSN